jgi:hypothetical protein
VAGGLTRLLNPKLEHQKALISSFSWLLVADDRLGRGMIRLH